jgi:hypothetical protein
MTVYTMAQRNASKWEVSKQIDEVIDMMKLICAAVGIGAIVIAISLAPDIKRYLRIRAM